MGQQTGNNKQKHRKRRSDGGNRIVLLLAAALIVIYVGGRLSNAFSAAPETTYLEAGRRRVYSLSDSL